MNKQESKKIYDMAFEQGRYYRMYLNIGNASKKQAELKNLGYNIACRPASNFPNFLERFYIGLFTEF